MSARDAVIVDAVRTPVGKRNGSLAAVHAVDLSAHVLNALVARNGFDPAVVDDVIWGCVQQVGQQAGNVGRMAVLAAGWPESVPGTTVDRQCGSSQQTIHFAAAGLVSGQYDVAVAGGVEMMSAVPLGAMAMFKDLGRPGGPKVRERYGVTFNQGIGAEMMAEKWGLSRDQLDEFSSASHAKLAAATDEGRLAGQIAPVELPDGRVLSADEGLRRGTSPEKLAGLKPVFKEDGVIHAGNSSQISDGAAALLMMTSDKARELGLTPLARVRTAVLAGDDPVIMLTAPIPATLKALKKSGLSIRRHRRVRGQRGVRPGTAGLAGRDRRRPGPAQPGRRGHRHRPPARRLRRPADDRARPPHDGRRHPVRPADHVRGRRHGQRHHHRAHRLIAAIRGLRAGARPAVDLLHSCAVLGVSPAGFFSLTCQVAAADLAGGSNARTDRMPVLRRAGLVPGTIDR